MSQTDDNRHAHKGQKETGWNFVGFAKIKPLDKTAHVKIKRWFNIFVRYITKYLIDLAAECSLFVWHESHYQWLSGDCHYETDQQNHHRFQ